MFDQGVASIEPPFVDIECVVAIGAYIYKCNRSIRSDGKDRIRRSAVSYTILKGPPDHVSIPIQKRHCNPVSRVFGSYRAVITVNLKAIGIPLSYRRCRTAGNGKSNAVSALSGYIVSPWTNRVPSISG